MIIYNFYMIKHMVRYSNTLNATEIKEIIHSELVSSPMLWGPQHCPICINTVRKNTCIQGKAQPAAVLLTKYNRCARCCLEIMCRHSEQSDLRKACAPNSDKYPIRLRTAFFVCYSCAPNNCRFDKSWSHGWQQNP